MKHLTQVALLVLTATFAASAFLACNGGDDSSPSPTASTPVASNGGDEQRATATQELTSGDALSTVDIARLLRPAVVQVATESAETGFFGEVVPTQGIGTGIIIDADGHVLTNNHVVRAGGDPSGSLATQITVTLSDSRALSATVVGTDPQTDIAVLKINASRLTPATLGSAENLPVGAEVVAMGYALGLEGDPSVTQGVVSAKNRTIQETEVGVSIPDAIQTDASINPGNSGGPLVDQQGRVIGINTAIIPNTQNIGFAISIDLIKPILQELIQTGQVQRAFLGITLEDVTANLAQALNLPTSQGVRVVSVEVNTPAADSGLQSNDVIVGLDSHDIKNSGDLLEALRAYSAGDKATIHFYRDGNEKKANVTLGDRPGQVQ
ncbi:MAG: trypsin-like peptidase domain-containing protein [Dehalococcoidia bacterium]